PTAGVNCKTRCDSVAGTIGFSRTVENLFYSFVSADCSQLIPNTIDGVGRATHYTPGAPLFDFGNCPDTPSTYSTKSSGTVFSIAIDDNTFALGIGWTS